MTESNTNALDREELDYLSDNLYILSALYGILRSTDLISYYRLEMNNKLYIDDKNLYDYWGDEPYKVLFKDNDIVINLASVEYSKMISKHLKEGYKHFIAGNKRVFRNSAEYKRQIKKEFLYFLFC